MMPKVLLTPSLYINKAFHSPSNNTTQCVEFIRQALGAPVTSSWYEGIKIVQLKAGEHDPVASGTAIATFIAGKYPQIDLGPGGKHAAIYLSQNAEGIQVLDQWESQHMVKPRTIYWKPHRPGRSNLATAFSVIEW